MIFSNFWYILSALIPVFLILFFVFKQDSFPEPKKIVFKTFIFGAAITLALNLILIDVDNFSENFFQGETLYFFDSFIRAAFLEEFFKMMVIIFFCTRNDEFDEPMDGLVYGVAASLGFAAYENIQYVLYHYKNPSFEIAFVRAFSAVPMHALCGVIMGFFITKAIFEKNKNYQYLIFSLLIPVGMHGLYNYSYMSPIISNQIPNIILFVFFVIAINLFKNLKSKQKQSIIFNKKYYTINIGNFVNATTTVLLIYLLLTYVVNIFL